MSRIARPTLLNALNGILPFWKSPKIDERVLFTEFHRLLLRDLGVTFRFVKDWKVLSVARLPIFASGASGKLKRMHEWQKTNVNPLPCSDFYQALLAVGSGLRVARENLGNTLNAIYRARIHMQRDASSTSSFPNDICGFNRFLSNYVGNVSFDPSIICNFDQDIGLKNPVLKRDNFHWTFELSISAINCIGMDEKFTTIDISCKPTFLIPHFLGRLQTEMNCTIVLQKLCRVKLGPFQQSDCITIDENLTYERVREKIKQTVIMHADLLENYFSSDEWRTLGM